MGKEKRLEYIKATVYTTTQGVEALSAILPSYGIDSFCVEDPADMELIMASKDKLSWDYIDVSLEPENSGGETRLVFWLDKGDESTLEGLRIALMKLKGDEQYGLYGAGADFGRLWLDTEVVSNDWKDKYKESFHTFSPCEGIVVSPPWEGFDDSGPGDALRIVIDPGMAFGTGSHETTRMCISRLKSLLKPGDSVLDAGAGSGILSIAAAMLGAAHVLAVEIDADAAASAAGNIEANGVADLVELVTGDIANEGTLPEDARFNLITANLSCSLLEGLLPVFKRLLQADGAMILSGLLDTQGERALEALRKEGLSASEITADGEWLMIEARK